VELELDDALPCGLLISEVITNSLKHAFPQGRVGEIRILLRRQARPPSIAVSDNGAGLPDNLDWTTTRSLGLRLVRALALQLRGSLDIHSGAAPTWSSLHAEEQGQASPGSFLRDRRALMDRRPRRLG